MPTCIDLKERFDRKYRVRYEQSYHADRGEGARTHDPWLLIVLCQRGHIYPHGGDYLAASTNSRGKTAKRLSTLDGCQIHQDGDDGVTVVFHVDQFEDVVKLLKPRRRRQLTEQQRLELAERGRAALAKVRFANVQAPDSDPGRDFSRKTAQESSPAEIVDSAPPGVNLQEPPR